MTGTLTRQGRDALHRYTAMLPDLTVFSAQVSLRGGKRTRPRQYR
jgi:hypothetical protein